MPLPLPRDPQFRKEVIQAWLDDVEDRLELGQHEGALLSWKTANDLLLQLPPGHGDLNLEDQLVALRVKINNHSHITNENPQL